jgi:hypothetical protein
MAFEEYLRLEEWKGYSFDHSLGAPSRADIAEIAIGRQTRTPDLTRAAYLSG